MGKIDTLSKTSKFAKNVFLISLAIFLISLLPVSYTVGFSNGLAGAAGASNPDPEKPANVPDFVVINYYITIIAGVIGSVSLATSAVANLQIARTAKETERIKLDTEKMRREMQLKEVEIYHLEKEAEERKKKKKG